VVDKFDAKHIFDCVVAVVLHENVIESYRYLRDKLAWNPGMLGQALEALLDGPLAQSPILLVLDGLDCIVELPTSSDAMPAIQAEFRSALIGVLKTFGMTKSNSRLILTSRYLFVLPDETGNDIAAYVPRVPLCPMTEWERQKQRFAVAGDLSVVESDYGQTSLEIEAGGNPGLQAVFMATSPGGDLSEMKDEAVQTERWFAKSMDFVEQGAPGCARRNDASAAQYAGGLPLFH